MSSWHRLAEIIKEERQFRGDSFVSYNELARLFVGSEKSPGITGRPPDRNGGMVTGKYKFDPSILALGDSKGGDVMAWHDEMEPALARAVTDSARSIQGAPQGGTVVKKNYGGKVTMQNAPHSPHHNDRLGSSMDRYDVVIEADIDWTMNRKGAMVPVGVLRKIAWAPSMGSSQERGDRLQSLMAGQGVGLPRRPQPEVPGLSKRELDRQADVQRRARERDAATSADDDDKPSLGARGGSATNQGFKDKLSRMNRDYQPHGIKPNQKAPDPEDALFWSPDKRK